MILERAEEGTLEQRDQRRGKARRRPRGFGPFERKITTINRNIVFLILETKVDI